MISAIFKSASDTLGERDRAEIGLMAETVFDVTASFDFGALISFNAVTADDETALMATMQASPYNNPAFPVAPNS
ncbi:hypothetical protein C7I85_24965 [Mesorhizobium soli]|uniref:Uncharacterized protein n=1 Tax=Pseudaminobacter soli (ex Li et al. 2025) TaxID=1295366 RepID=A0A2P7S185_9HYPH|nr:hypothetical protein C7I85_24965 [Mesorhizobium soli]